MKEEIKALSGYRLSRAKETFNDGLKLLENKSFIGATNRFYYAAFYAARALLATKELDSSKHTGVISLFNQHFVKTNIMKLEVSKILQKSFEIRQDTDYEDFAEIAAEEVICLREEVSIFIKEVENALNKILK